MTFLRTLYFFILFALLSSTTYGKAYTWTGENDVENISPFVSLLCDEKVTFTIDSVLGENLQKEFFTNGKGILTFGISTDHYWVKVEVNNDSDEEIYLVLEQVMLGTCDFYQKKDNKWEETKLGFKTNIADRLEKDPSQVYNLRKGLNTVYIHLFSENPPIPVKLYKKKHFISNSTFTKVAYGVYFGLMIFVLFNNIFHFFSSKQIIHLYYSLLIFIYIGVFALVMDGTGMFFFDDIDFIFWRAFIPIINGLGVILYSIFFLKLKIYSPRLNRLAWGCVYYWIVIYIILSLPFFDHIILVYLNTIHAVVFLAYSVIIGIIIGKKGNKIGYYYSSAYILFFASVVLETLYNQLGWPNYIYSISFVSTGVLGEVFLLSYALTKSFQWEKEVHVLAKLKAQGEVIRKTEENEAILTAQNEVLEQKVKERTVKLKETNNQLQVSLDEVEVEKGKTDSLLLNILPESTVKELKETGSTKPKIYDNTSIIFTDFKGFTAQTQLISPEELLDDLNVCFRGFDKIMMKHGLEKIKTIGDSYMAVCGLPITHPDHAIRTVNASFEIIQFMESWKKQRIEEGKFAWETRIGIHSGSVIAGIIGTHKFAFDIWGDAVNTASRMESSGEPGKVNISSSTYELIKNNFECTSRGSIEVKGKQAIEMFWVDKLL